MSQGRAAGRRLSSLDLGAELRVDTVPDEWVCVVPLDLLPVTPFSTPRAPHSTPRDLYSFPHRLHFIPRGR